MAVSAVLHNWSIPMLGFYLYTEPVCRPTIQGMA